MTGLTRKTSRSTYSQPYRNDLGRYYIEYAAPVVAQGDFVGTINSVISFDALLEKQPGMGRAQVPCGDLRRQRSGA